MFSFHGFSVCFFYNTFTCVTFCFFLRVFTCPPSLPHSLTPPLSLYLCNSFFLKVMCIVRCSGHENTNFTAQELFRNRSYWGGKGRQRVLPQHTHAHTHRFVLLHIWGPSFILKSFAQNSHLTFSHLFIPKINPYSNVYFILFPSKMGVWFVIKRICFNFLLKWKKYLKPMPH